MGTAIRWRARKAHKLTLWHWTDDQQRTACGRKTPRINAEQQLDPAEATVTCSTCRIKLEKYHTAVVALKSLALDWPKTLWLFAVDGTLHVMRYGPDGEKMMRSDGSFDPAAIVETVDIDCDGGDGGVRR